MAGFPFVRAMTRLVILTLTPFHTAARRCAALGVATGAGLRRHQHAQVAVAGRDHERHIRGVQEEATRRAVDGVPGGQRLKADPPRHREDSLRAPVLPADHLGREETSLEISMHEALRS